MDRTNTAKLLASGSITLLAVTAWLNCSSSNGSRNGGDGGVVLNSSSSSSSSSGGSGSDSGSSGPTDVCGQPSTTVTSPIIYNGATTTNSCNTVIGAPRSGYWYSYSDSASSDGMGGTLASKVSGVIPPAPGGCQGTADCAIETVGPAPGFSSYAGAGFNLGGGNGTNTAYDASMYKGIEFWTRGSIKGSRAGDNVNGFFEQDNTMYVQLVGMPLGPNEGSRLNGDEYGGYCVLNADPTVWTKCEVDFATAIRLQLSGPPDSGPDQFNPTQLYKIQFAFQPFNGNSADGAAPTNVIYDVFIDDVYFL